MSAIEIVMWGIGLIWLGQLMWMAHGLIKFRTRSDRRSS